MVMMMLRRLKHKATKATNDEMVAPMYSFRCAKGNKDGTAMFTDLDDKVLEMTEVKELAEKNSKNPLYGGSACGS